MKLNICFSTMSKVFVGTIAIIVAIAVFIFGNSKGIFTDAEGTEAYIRAVLMLIFGIGMILSPYYQKRKGDWSLKELLFYIGYAIFLEVISRYLVVLF